MKLLPRSLYGQLLLALLAGLLAAQGLGAWLMLDDRARLADRLLGAHAAQRIAGVISLLDAASPDERLRLVRALDVPPTRISLDEPWQTAASENSAAAEAFAATVVRDLERPLALQVLSIRRAAGGRADAAGGHRQRRADPPEAAAQDRAATTAPRRHGRAPVLLVVAQARLADGAVVSFRHVLPEAPADRPLRVLGGLALMALTVGLLAGWAVRRLTRPLSTLGAAATGLAQDLDQTPLPETGPLEVAHTARAFNAMQDQLKRTIAGRAQALVAVSHDLRLPITRLRLRLEALPDARMKTEIADDLAEMDAMIANTLDFLRAGSSREAIARLDLSAVLDSLAEDMQALGARVQVHAAPADPVAARPHDLRRCLGNLIDNARRYGGPEIEVTAEARDGVVDIRIEDRGPGIPEAERQRVFEPFVRLEASRAKNTGGTGVGMTIARAIARAHGGDIRLDARPGGGLTVVVTLPQDAARPAATPGDAAGQDLPEPRPGAAVLSSASPRRRGGAGG